MRILYLIIFLCISAFVLIICNIRFEDFLAFFARKKKEKDATLKDFAAIYNPELREKKGRFKTELGNIKDVLVLSGQEDKFDKVKSASVLCGIGGAITSILLGNYALIPVLSFAFVLIPFVYIKRICNRYEKTVDETVEATLSMITNSYLRTDDIVSAVEENLPYLQVPLKNHFERFVSTVKVINPNVTIALNQLKYKVSNPVFYDWCNRLIQCQSDRTLKHTLLPIIQRMSDLRALRAELAAELVGPRNEAITMAGLVVANIPLLWLMNKDWFYVLTDTIQGHIAIAIIFALLLVCGIRIWFLCQPLKYEDLEGR